MSTLPSLRERNRYIVFSVTSETKFDKDAVIRAIWNSSVQLFGESGTSRIGLWLMDWNDKTQKGILRVNRKSVDNARVVIAMISNVNNNPAAFHVLGVSGTVKKAREKWM